jgi:hypothetical protein
MEKTLLTSTGHVPKEKGGARTRTLPKDEYGNARLHPDTQNALDEQLAALQYNSESREET